jgi:E3 ubiquitin-protein ligase XBAT32/33
MQACQYGHWEVVQTLMLFQANVPVFSLYYFPFSSIHNIIGKLGRILTWFWICFQIHKTDYLNGGTAIHFAALNGHVRCIRLLLADYVPSASNFWNFMQNISVKDELYVGDHDLK